MTRRKGSRPDREFLERMKNPRDLNEALGSVIFDRFLKRIEEGLLICNCCVCGKHTENKDLIPWTHTYDGAVHFTNQWACSECIKINACNAKRAGETDKK